MAQTLDSFTTTTTLAANVILASDSNTKASDIFVLPTNANVASATFNLIKTGTPTGNVFYSIYAITGTPGTNAVPTGSALYSTSTLAATSVSTTMAPVELLFTGSVSLSAGTYAIVVEYSGGSFAGGNYLMTGQYSPRDTTKNVGRLFSGSWTTSGGTAGGLYYVVNTNDIGREQKGSAYIAAPTIAMPVQGIVGGWGSSTIGGQAAGEILRLQDITTDKTQVGNARISQVVSKTQTGNARITAVVSRTQVGNARITATATRTQVGNARIGLITTRDQVGNANIASGFTATDRPQTGNANIRNNTTRNQTGNARIRVTVSRTQTGNARITQIVSRTQSGNARITTTTTRNQIGNARITASATQNQTGNARIQLVTNRVQTGSALIAQEYLRTITGNARITKGIDYTQKPSLNVEQTIASVNPVLDKGQINIDRRKASINVGIDKPTLTVVNDKDIRLNIR